MSITIRQLAKIAGVSPSTISRCLNDSPLIPEETRVRIRQIASDEGFTFNSSARSLSLGRTGTIALIFPDYFESFSISLFFTALQRHVRANFERKNIDVLVAFPFNRFDRASNIEKLVRGRKIDGMLIIDNEFAQADRDCLTRAGIPYLFLHKHPDSSADPGADYFCTDHFEGGRLAAERLVALGRRRFLVATATGEEFESRTAGFMQGLKDAGCDGSSVEVVRTGLTFADGYSRIGGHVISAGPGAFDGVFCQSDLLALGAMSALGAAGLRIPEDVAIVGYDDIELGKDFHPALTTVRQPLEELATLACERLAARIEAHCADDGALSVTGKSAPVSEERRAHQLEPIRHLMKPTLIIRES